VIAGIPFIRARDSEQKCKLRTVLGMKILFKNLKNAVKAQFIEHRDEDVAVQQLNRLELGTGDRDTWVANAYLGRFANDRYADSGARRW